jgi:uncharacterized protein
MSFRFSAITLILAILALVIAIITHPSPAKPKNATTVQLGQHTLSVEVARTPAEHAKGLSDRDTLAPYDGLLFDFRNEQDKVPTFWMKDMRFNIDIIWIAGEKVVGIEANVPKPSSTDSALPTYPAPQPIDFVLEVSSGWTNKHAVGIGTVFKD